MPLQTLTIQSGTGSNDDTYITDSATTSNFGGGSTLSIGHDETGKTPTEIEYRGLVRFDVSSISSSYTILNATLTLFYTSGSGPQNITLARSADNWTELGATWNTYNGVNAWTGTAGGATTPNTTVAYAGGNLVFDAYSLVVDAIQNRSGILRCVVDGDSVDSGELIVFGSFDNGTSNLRPQLVVNYLTPETAQGGFVLDGDYGTMHLGAVTVTSSGGAELSGSADAVIGSIDVEQDFAWNILTAVSLDIDSTWDIGNQVLRYYIVEGECQSPPTCDNTGFDFNDEKCDSGVRFFQTFAATDLSDLCDKMQAIFLNYPIKWPIKRIRRFSRPVYLDDSTTADLDCNSLEDQEFCHIPECFSFCLDEDLVVDIGAVVVVQDAFFNYVSDGGLILDGLGIIESPEAVASGGITLSGDALAFLGVYQMVMGGGLLAEGETTQTSPDWHYDPAGGLELAGEEASNASNFNTTADGGIELSGTHPDAHMTFRHTDVNVSLTLEGDDTLSDVSYRYLPDGLGLTVEGSATVISSHYSYVASDGVVTGGEAGAKSPVWHYTVSGGINLSNPELFKALSEGGLTAAGDAITGIAIVPDGGVTLGGETTQTSPDWHYTPDGSIMTLAGVADTSFILLGDYFVDVGADVELVLLEPQYPTETNLLPLTSQNAQINTSCACDPTPNRLQMSHNINATSQLKDFLFRNELSLPSQLNLIYNQRDNTWRSTRHFKGTGSNANEKWSILFEWICNLNPVSGIDEEDGPATPDERYWKFSVLVKRDIDGNVRESRVLYTFPAESACDNNQLRFSFRINTNTKSVVAPTNLQVGDSIIYDGLGLFSGRDWQKKPNILINIFEQDLPSETPTVDIQPIFPE